MLMMLMMLRDVSDSEAASNNHRPRSHASECPNRVPHETSSRTPKSICILLLQVIMVSQLVIIS